LLVSEKSLGLAPWIVTADVRTEAAPIFDIVMVCELLVVPAS